MFILGQLLCSCNGESKNSSLGGGNYFCADSVIYNELEYSQMLRFGYSCGARMVEIRSIIGKDTLVKHFALIDSSKKILHKYNLEQLKHGHAWKNVSVLHVPISRTVVLSSSHIGYMARLGITDRIVGVGETKYIVDSTLYSRIKNIASLGNGSSLNYEKLLSIKPDLVMTFATGGSEDDYERLEKLGIPVMLTSEWQENSPLAKAEWIKLYGMLFNKLDADFIFEQSKKKYEMRRHENLSSLAPKPRVLAGMAYNGVWYAPGGNSYTAKLIRDGGGRYLWDTDTTREMKLSLEEIFLYSDSADVWLNPGVFMTPEEILAAEPRVKYIKAFKEGRVCQNDARKGIGGGNDFYEGAVARPFELLNNVTECINFDLNAPKSVNLERTPYKWYRNIFKL